MSKVASMPCTGREPTLACGRLSMMIFTAPHFIRRSVFRLLFPTQVRLRNLTGFMATKLISPQDICQINSSKFTFDRLGQARRLLLALACIVLLGILTLGRLDSAVAQGTPQGSLEFPASNSAQSGIGFISGWVCEATNVEIEINGISLGNAASGGQRADTEFICGDTDNGFGIPFNWNLLGDGEHTVVAWVDGVELGRATVTVTTLGQEFLRDVAGTCEVEDFPTVGETVTVAWQQNSQNFVITSGARPAGENRAGVAGVGYDVSQFSLFTVGSYRRSSGGGGGGGGTQDQHGNTPAQATPVSLGEVAPWMSSTAGQINATDDIDYFQITVPHAGVLVVETRGSTDTVGTAWQDGEEVARAASGGEQRNFRLSVRVAAGPVLVAVAGNGSRTGAYTLATTLVVGYLENPGPASFQSGIDFISGWVCEADEVEIQIGDLPVQEAAYETERLDTLDACGDTDNGFGLLFNWSLLGDGEHEVVALVDGVELGRASVTVTTRGGRSFCGM